MKSHAYNTDKLFSELSRDEGVKKIIYKDTEGIWTGGLGHNLTKPLSNATIILWYQEDIAEARNALNTLHPKWHYEEPARQRVLLNMAFNLGLPRFRKFKRFWVAVQVEDWIEAGKEMEDSKWWGQVKSRGPRLRKQLIKGGS